MYAITSVSSSAYQMARVTNELEQQIRSTPAPAPSQHQQPQNSAQPLVAEPAAPLSSYNSAQKAQQSAPIHRNSAAANVRRQRFSRPQQERINQFNAEMVTQSSQNTVQSAPVKTVSQSQNIKTAQRPPPILTESPYLIVVLNQNLTNMQKYAAESPSKSQSKSAPKKAESI